MAVIDTGVGIAPENMIRIFTHGFTTKKTGHGFGLHSGALAAKELGGELLDPLKTTVVQSLRCMTTWIVRKVERVDSESR